MAEASAAPQLVFDIGGTKIAAGVLLADFTVHCRREIATKAVEGPERVIGRCAALGRQVLTAYSQALPSLPQPQQAGVASAGQIDWQTGAVHYATLHLPGWKGFPLGERLAQELGMPAAVDNDANCHALAEAVLGAGRPYRHFLLAAVGTGIGGGVVIDGKVYRGRLGAAGEIGQVNVVPHEGRPCSEHLTGCLEAYAAASVILQRSQYSSLQSLATDYSAGKAIAAVDEGAGWLGMGLATIAHVLAPEAILIGGSVALFGGRYLAAVAESFVRCTLPSHQGIPLLFTQLGIDSGLIGAGLGAIEHAAWAKTHGKKEQDCRINKIQAMSSCQ